MSTQYYLGLKRFFNKRSDLNRIQPNSVDARVRYNHRIISKNMELVLMTDAMIKQFNDKKILFGHDTIWQSTISNANFINEEDEWRECTEIFNTIDNKDYKVICNKIIGSALNILINKAVALMFVDKSISTINDLCKLSLTIKKLSYSQHIQLTVDEDIHNMDVSYLDNTNNIGVLFLRETRVNYLNTNNQAWMLEDNIDALFKHDETNFIVEA